MYTSPFRLSGVTVVPFNDIFPARNSTKYLLEEPREPGTRLGNRAPEVVILGERPACKPDQYLEAPLPPPMGHGRDRAKGRRQAGREGARGGAGSLERGRRAGRHLSRRSQQVPGRARGCFSGFSTIGTIQCTPTAPRLPPRPPPRPQRHFCGPGPRTSSTTSWAETAPTPRTEPRLRPGSAGTRPLGCGSAVSLSRNQRGGGRGERETGQAPGPGSHRPRPPPTRLLRAGHAGPPRPRGPRVARGGWAGTAAAGLRARGPHSHQPAHGPQASADPTPAPGPQRRRLRPRSRPRPPATPSPGPRCDSAAKRRPGSLFLLSACRAPPEVLSRSAPPAALAADWAASGAGPTLTRQRLEGAAAHRHDPPRPVPPSGGSAGGRRAGQSGPYCCCVIGVRRRPLAAALGMAWQAPTQLWAFEPHLHSLWRAAAPAGREGASLVHGRRCTPDPRTWRNSPRSGEGRLRTRGWGGPAPRPQEECDRATVRDSGAWAQRPRHQRWSSGATEAPPVPQPRSPGNGADMGALHSPPGPPFQRGQSPEADVCAQSGGQEARRPSRWAPYSQE